MVVRCAARIPARVARRPGRARPHCGTARSIGHHDPVPVTPETPTSRPAEERELDLVLVGATGFVGALTAQHLAAAAGAEQGRPLRIALAGRSLPRLEALRASLGHGAADWPLVQVDVTDPAAASALAARARVIATTVGPYAVSGLQLLRACAAKGTDYADLTGEVSFLQASVTQCHAEAERTGARLVHACGFDSVPSDLGVLMTAMAAEGQGQGRLSDTVLRVRSMRGGISGGTVDSMRQEVMAAGRDPQVRRQIGHARHAVGADERPHRHDGRWQVPFVMGPFNASVVRRSADLLGYGEQLSYRELVDTGRGVRGALVATGLTAGLAATATAMRFRPSRAVADRLLPSPGDGPSAAARAEGRFRLEIDALTSTGATYRTEVGADLDPGYGGTAVMFGQSALALAAGEGTREGGVLTPASALGADLVRRLWEHDFILETERTG